MSNMKKYLVTAITLGAIAMCAGALIGATNLVTRGPIAEYEKNQINNGIKEIFDGYENIHYANDSDVQIDKNNPYVTHVYYVYDGTSENYADNAFVGYAIKTEGSNSYGKISLIVGFNSSAFYKSITVIKNEQSFASTLKRNYINAVKAGEREVDDVSCGATYGAKLIRDMVNNAEDVIKNQIIKE